MHQDRFRSFECLFLGNINYQFLKTEEHYTIFVQVLGSGLIGLGIWLQISYNGFFTILPQHEILNLEYLLLMSGVLFFITAFLGCGGAWCKNGCLLTLVTYLLNFFFFYFFYIKILLIFIFIQYFVLVALFCVAEITCGILGFFFSDHLSSNLQQELLTGMQYYYNISSNNLGITMGWDHVQHEVIITFLIFTIIVVYTAVYYYCCFDVIDVVLGLFPNITHYTIKQLNDPSEPLARVNNR